VQRSRRDATQDASGRLLRVSSTDQNQVPDDDGAGAGAAHAVAVAVAVAVVVDVAVDALAGADDDTASKPHVVPDTDREGCFEFVAALLQISGVGRCQQLDVRPDLAVLRNGDRSSQTVTPHAAAARAALRPSRPTLPRLTPGRAPSRGTHPGLRT